MGGINTMVNWALKSPPLAAKDYTHLSFKGAEVLGTTFFNTIMINYNKKLLKHIGIDVSEDTVEYAETSNLDIFYDDDE